MIDIHGGDVVDVDIAAMHIGFYMIDAFVGRRSSADSVLSTCGDYIKIQRIQN